MRLIHAATVALLFLGQFQAHAAEAEPSLQPLNVRGTYQVYFGGVPMAKLWMSIEEEPHAYQLTTAIKSKGIVRMFKRVRSINTSNGIRTPQGWQTLRMSIKSEYADGTKETRLVYNEAGELIERFLSEDDDPSYRPPVDKALLRGVPTYGNAFLVLRDAIDRAVKQNDKTFTTEVYDAKRLTRVTAVIEGEQDYQIKGANTPVYRIRFSRELIAGFTEKEKKRYAEGEPPLYLYVAKNNLMPIALEIKFAFGGIKAYWEEDKPDPKPAR